MELRAPAKINLFLRVGKRGDGVPPSGGFHPLQTWMCIVGLFDTLRLQLDRDDSPVAASSADAPRGNASPDGASPARSFPRATLGRAGEPGLTLACDDPRLQTDARNLVMRAMKALADPKSVPAGAKPVLVDTMPRASAKDADGGGEAPTASRAASAVSAFLHKRIPAGAGLGGGSSDAATTLLAMNALLRLGLSIDQLARMAAQLGSDVPFFLHGPSAICAGRGEIVRPIPSPRVARWAVLVLPEIEMPTPAVYQRFDEMGLGDESLNRTGPNDVADAGIARWTDRAALPADALLALLTNDLEPAAFAIRPDLGKLRSAIEATLQGQPVRMSGSGSALFTLFDDERDARVAKDSIVAKHALRTQTVELAPLWSPLPSGEG